MLSQAGEIDIQNKKNQINKVAYIKQERICVA